MDAYLSETLGFRMFLKTKGREMDAGTEHFGLCQDADSTDTVEFHFHVWIAIRVSKISQMRPPGRIFGITLHNHRIFVKGFGQLQCGF